MLTLNNIIIPIISNVNYLGIVFDKRLIWTPHLKYKRNSADFTFNMIPSSTFIQFVNHLKTLNLQGQIGYMKFKHGTWLNLPILHCFMTQSTFNN